MKATKLSVQRLLKVLLIAAIALLQYRPALAQTEALTQKKALTQKEEISQTSALLHTRALSHTGALSQTTTEELFSLNLKNADIHSLIETVSSQTGKNFIVDPRVRATVTVITSEPVNKNKLYDVFLSVLEVHGYATVPAGSFTKIVPMATGVKSAVPVSPTPVAKLDELITEVIQIEYAAAEEMIPSLRPLLSESATISAEAVSNTIVITDHEANIAKLVEIIRLLDR